MSARCVCRPFLAVVVSHLLAVFVGHSSRLLFILAAFFISSLIFLFVVSTWFFWLSVYNHLIFN